MLPTCEEAPLASLRMKRAYEERGPANSQHQLLYKWVEPSETPCSSWPTSGPRQDQLNSPTEPNANCWSHSDEQRRMLIALGHLGLICYTVVNNRYKGEIAITSVKDFSHLPSEKFLVHYEVGKVRRGSSLGSRAITVVCVVWGSRTLPGVGGGGDMCTYSSPFTYFGLGTSSIVSIDNNH